MIVEEIKEKLAKKAVEFTTGGFKPTNSIFESWIGKVYLYKENEEIPTGKNGKLMFPLFQLCLEKLPFIPNILKNTKVITVFISENFPMDVTPNGANWLLREYKFSDELVVKNLTNPQSQIKPFPLTHNFIEQDFPVWDGGGIPKEIATEILALENLGKITDYYDVFESHYMHKVGGYPTFCQSGIDFGDNFEFVFQISSDKKAELNIVDFGTMFFAKNKKTEDWNFSCDFY
jgi:hypothetical protein